MRKSLWIIPVLFAAIVVPYANADSITDPSVITKFKCCDGAKVPIHDLEITFNAPITSFIHNLGLDGTTKGKGTGTVTVTCTNAIPVGDIVPTIQDGEPVYLAHGKVDSFGDEGGAGGQNRTGYARLFRAALYQ